MRVHSSTQERRQTVIADGHTVECEMVQRRKGFGGTREVLVGERRAAGCECVGENERKADLKKQKFKMAKYASTRTKHYSRIHGKRWDS